MLEGSVCHPARFVDAGTRNNAGADRVSVAGPLADNVSVGAVWVGARADMRSRWRSWLMLALLVALAGGSVIALAAGARRTDSAYPRFLQAQRAADVIVFLGGTPTLPAQVQHLPEVAESATAMGIATTETDLVPVVVTDGGLGRNVNRLKFLAGRPVNPDRADEVVVGFLVAQARHLHVGSPMIIHVPTGQPPAPQAVNLRVVGIEAAPGDFPPRASSASVAVFLSPAFLHTPIGAQASQGSQLTIAVPVRLHRGIRDRAAFQTGVDRLAGGPVGLVVLADQSPNVQRSLHLQAVALWLMAGLAALAAALVMLQLLVRQASEDSDEHPTLRALGMTSPQLLGSGMVRVAFIAVAGTAGAVVVAGLLSPLLPLGVARIAEPHPGLALDATAIGLGAAGVLLVVSLLGAGALVQITRRAGPLAIEENRRDRPSAVDRARALARLPLVVTTGVRLALQPGRGRTAVPVRATLAAAAIGVGTMAAAVTFGASLGHLLATPALYGVTFDGHVQANNFGDIRSVLPALQSDPDIAAIAVGLTGIPLHSGRLSIGGQATASLRGSLDPTVIEGRLPVSEGEIVLGSRTMLDLHTHIGQTVAVALEGLTRAVPMRVVGRGVLAPINDTEQLGRGAVLAPSAITATASLAPPGFKIPPPGDAFVRFRPGVDRSSKIGSLQNQLGATGDVTVVGPAAPTDVANFGQVRNLPQLLAGLLGVLAAATMAHLLVSAIRRRRRDLAILKALGIVPRQVSAAIAWQATTVALVALLLGLPLGLAAGRSAWYVVAGQLGVVVRPAVPWAVVIAIVPAALLIANLVAAGPALAAGRIRPATVLRSE
jgi:hypothetical protein